MIIYKNNNDFKLLLEQEKQLNEQVLEHQKNQKNLLMGFIIKFVDYIDNINIESTEEFTSYIEKIKSSIELCNESINSINEINQALHKITNAKSKHNDALCRKYNDIYYTNMEKINTNNSKLLDVIYLISQNTNLNTANASNELSNNKFASIEAQNAQPPTVIDQNFYTNAKTDIDENKNIEEEQIQINNVPENTLLISESMQKVILPYTYESIENYLEQYSTIFENKDDVINKLYTIPLKYNNNPAIARFKETFRLMREKEKASIKDAIDLGLELMFNYNLYPAIITACKNLDELDIYLAYLETGEIDKFKIFNIIYQLSPTLSK